MGVYHGVDETDAARQARGERKRKGGQDPWNNLYDQLFNPSHPKRRVQSQSTSDLRLSVQICLCPDQETSMITTGCSKQLRTTVPVKIPVNLIPKKGKEKATLGNWVCTFMCG